MFLDRSQAAEAEMLADFFLTWADSIPFPLVEQKLIDFILPLSESRTHAFPDTGFLTGMQEAI